MAATVKESRKTGQFGYLLEIEALHKKEAIRRNPQADALYNCDFDDFFSREPSRAENSYNYFEMNDDEEVAITARPIMEKRHTFSNLTILFRT